MTFDSIITIAAFGDGSVELQRLFIGHEKRAADSLARG